MTQTTTIEKLSADFRKLAEHVGLVKPEPRRARPPLSEEERTACNSQLTALRAEWRKTETKLRGVFDKTTAEKEAQMTILERFRDVERDAFHLLMAAEDKFKAAESALVDRLKAGAPSLIERLCEQIEAMKADLIKSGEVSQGPRTGQDYYDQKIRESATFKRAGALEELRLTIKRSWPAFGDDEAGLLARFNDELAAIPTVSQIVEERKKPRTQAPRVVDGGVPNPSLKDPKIMRAHGEMWSTPGAPRPGVVWHDAA